MFEPFEIDQNGIERGVFDTWRKRLCAVEQGSMGGGFLQFRTRAEQEAGPGVELNFCHTGFDVGASRLLIHRENFFERRLAGENRDGLGA